jgi:hypothetical protein
MISATTEDANQSAAIRRGRCSGDDDAPHGLVAAAAASAVAGQLSSPAGLALTDHRHQSNAIGAQGLNFVQITDEVRLLIGRNTTAPVDAGSLLRRFELTV